MITAHTHTHTQVVGKEINMPWEWNGPASPPTNNVHSDQLRFGVTCLWLQKPELKMRPELCFVTETCDWPFELSLWLYIGITAPVNLRIHAEYITTKIVALLRDIWLFKRIFLPIDQLHRTSNRTEACTPTCITCSVTSFYFPGVYELIDLGFIT